MDNLVNRETPAQRDVWNYKIQELREQERSIRRQAEHYDRMVSANVLHQKERDELLSRRRKGRRTENDTMMDDLVQEGDSLANSHNMVGELIASGTASLDDLVRQREKLRGTKRVLFDIGSKIGLSNSTMRIIERRDITDAYLVFGLMVVTLIVIYFLYF